MRIGLLTEGGYPYVSGDARLWCDRLVRGLGQHEFDIYALSRSERQEDEGWVQLPPQVGRVRTAPLWTRRGRRGRCTGGARAGGSPSATASWRRVAVRGAAAGRTPAGASGGGVRPPRRTVSRNALYGLAELARDEGGLVAALRSETAVRALERACRAPGALRAAREARVPDLLAVAAHLERALRPLSLDWYEDDGLGAVDLCHAASGGAGGPARAARPPLLRRARCW